LEASTTAFMTDMLRFGPSKYDVAVVYESVALAQIATAEGRWGKLRIYYPQTTLWSDHPAAVLRGEWVSEMQRAAARQLIAHLKSRPMQEMAMNQYGFRPADPSVPIRTGDPQSPFARNADRGVKLDIPAMAPAPSGEVVRAMLATWTRVLAK
jgi:ABC-type sulfate transport system substrate-binding protein